MGYGVAQNQTHFTGKTGKKNLKTKERKHISKKEKERNKRVHKNKYEYKKGR